VQCTVIGWLTQLNDVATIKTLPWTASSTKFFLSTFSVYPHALVKNAVAPMSVMMGSEAYKIFCVWMGRRVFTSCSFVDG
jgi:hypothetical protein